MPATNVAARASRTGSRRLFLALWPTVVERRQWIDAVRPLLPPGAGRRTLPEDLHLTLVFLGQVGAARQARLETALRQVRAVRFRLRFTTLECWNGGRVCCLAAIAVPSLLQLHRQLLTCARRAGIPVETRPLRAHVTLARDLPASVAATIAGDVPPVALLATGFYLVASEPHARVGRYRRLRRWPLR